ncbi:MAG: ABC-three component system protein [Pseudomonadota bacterium]
MRFHQGLNVVLATTTDASDDHATRNSVGKTSFVELVHFLLGADSAPDSIFRNEALIEQTFTGTLRIKGRDVCVSRSGSAQSKIFISPEDAAHLGVEAKLDRESGLSRISNTIWKEALGHAFFSLPLDMKGSEYGEPFTPSFRALLSYFARREEAGAFDRPEKQAKEQRDWDLQVNMSYLLGLDWRIARELKLTKDREKQLGEVRKAAWKGAFGQVLETSARIRPRLAKARARAERLGNTLATFRVHQAYDDQMQRAVAAKREIQAITRRAIPVREQVTHLKMALETEDEPSDGQLERLYQAVGVELPDLVRRRFEEVQLFHEQLVDNRRLRLQEEIERLESTLREQEARSEKLDEERSSILRDLEGQGALSEFISLQKSLAEAEAAAASLQDRFEAAQTFEKEYGELTEARARTYRRLLTDHAAKRDAIDRAVILVDEARRRLYDDRDGGLEIGPSENGPVFGVTFEGGRGGGVSSMELFCLDYALYNIWVGSGAGPGFLIHDSHLFDGVDKRQVAEAIALGTEAADLANGQYIITMNSDIFETLPLPESIDREAVVVEPVLSDESSSSGLFGLRFD